VVAIIAILASMLLPALGKARAKARAITCVNNLKQCMMATILYSDDNNDYVLLKIKDNPGYRYLLSAMVAGAVVGQGSTVGSAPSYLPGFNLITCPSIRPCDKDGNPLSSLPAKPRAPTPTDWHNFMSIYSVPYGPTSAWWKKENLTARSVYSAADFDGTKITNAPTYVAHRLPNASDFIVYLEGIDTTNKCGKWNYNLNSCHFRHSGTMSIACADGHVQLINPSYLAAMKGDVIAGKQTSITVYFGNGDPVTY
jgi:type II secretory pathway pseudopilin PulG